MEEMLNDGLDSALDNDDVEEEIEEEVDKVLSELAVETSVQLPAAGASRQKVKPPAEAQATKKVYILHNTSIILTGYGPAIVRFLSCKSRNAGARTRAQIMY